MAKKLKIKSEDIALTEADVARLVGEVVEHRIAYDATFAKMNEQIDGIRKAFEAELNQQAEQIHSKSLQVEAWTRANRAQFESPRSREFARGTIGLELGNWAVATVRGITQKLAVKRLLATRWGRRFVRHPEPVLNKELLLQHRDKLTERQLKIAGLQFAQEERFFLTPKLDKETAPTSAV
jgi:phage host-nuclease inhibitor protein Gam